MNSTRPGSGAPVAFLRAAVVLFGAAVLAFMIWEPRLEGRNANATSFEIYFKDPFLAYAYLGSIPFFVALYQAFTALGYIGQDKAFAPTTIKAAGTIKKCGLALFGFVAVGAIFILLFGDKEDRPPGVFMSVLCAFASSVIAAAGGTVERVLRSGADPAP